MSIIIVRNVTINIKNVDGLTDDIHDYNFQITKYNLRSVLRNSFNNIGNGWGREEKRNSAKFNPEGNMKI